MKIPRLRYTTYDRIICSSASIAAVAPYSLLFFKYPTPWIYVVLVVDVLCIGAFLYAHWAPACDSR